MSPRLFLYALAGAAISLAGRPGAGQSISNLESGRPVTVEDATPVAKGAFSASFDYAFARRLDSVEYNGPALALNYGPFSGVELGMETRWLSHPRLNAQRGIGSGDFDVHALGSLAAELPKRPAIGVRVDATLPTGVASHGTNFSIEALATKSFDAFRLHANAGLLYVGDTRMGERRNRLFAVAGADAAVFGPWNTNTLAVADVVLRQSIDRDGKTSAGFELGFKQRTGMQTVLYAGASTEFAGERDRIRYRAIVGFTHTF